MSGGNLYRYRDLRVVSRKGNPMFMWKNLKTDHENKAYKDIDCALKINEGSIAKTCIY